MDILPLYKEVQTATFMGRGNRFVAHARLEEGGIARCHVKNTGRLRELLVPGARVIVSKAGAGNRSTQYDLVAVYKEDVLFNIDSQAPNKIFGAFVKSGGFFGEAALVKSEQTKGDSRFDFYLETQGFKGYAEVKGVTLEQDGAGLFPDAPTERGIKHLNGLIELRKAGMDACAAFVLQFAGAKHFSPNDGMHKEFGDALRRAQTAGVLIKAFTCNVAENGFAIDGEVPVVL